MISRESVVSCVFESMMFSEGISYGYGLGGVAGGLPTAEGVASYWRGLCRYRSIRPAGASISQRRVTTRLYSIRRANRRVGGFRTLPSKTTF